MARRAGDGRREVPGGREGSRARTGYWFRYLAEEISADAAKRERLLRDRYEIPATYLSTATGERVPTERLRIGVAPADD